MAEHQEITIEHAEEAPQKRSLMLPVLLVILAAAVFAGAFFLLGGMDLIDDFFGAGDPVVEVPPKPQPEPSDVATTTAPVAEDPPSIPAEAQQWMYWEQVDSQEQIGRLVSGDIERLTLSNPRVGSDDATLRVQTSEGVTGEVVLRNHDGAWFFERISAGTARSRGPEGREGDTSVVETIVKEQAESQDVIGAFVDGGYTTIDVVEVQNGPGTATITVRLGGGTKPAREGSIVAISKDIRGTTHWFLARFKES